MARAPALTLACATLVACLGGCERATPAEGWFPLAAGHRWTYRVTTRGNDETTLRESLTLRTLGPEVVPALGASAWRRRSESGVDYWLRADESGIYRVASKSDLDAEPQLDKPPRFVLKAPYTVGTQWQSTTTAYLLMRSNDFPREIRHTHPSVTRLYTIAAVDQPVETPAGRFEHCLRVSGAASVHLYADPASGWRDMPISTTEWYCPAVGLVRVERNEPARSAFLTGGTRTLELESWQ